MNPSQPPPPSPTPSRIPLGERLSTILSVGALPPPTAGDKTKGGQQVDQCHVSVDRQGSQAMRKKIRDKPTKGSMRQAFTVEEPSIHDPLQEQDGQELQDELSTSCWRQCLCNWDITPWLIKNVQYQDDDGDINNNNGSNSNMTPYFERRWTLQAFVRYYFYNPIQPEFTSVQLFCWAVGIGIFMGIYTAGWKTLVEAGIDLVWKDWPEMLQQRGYFTDLDGNFPLYHYMWIVPTIAGALLSYAFVRIPSIPGQNEWISALHKTGVQNYSTFCSLFILTTLAMISGLSLGPELPLILTSGMFGSWLGMACHQSKLQARVLNLTAASAAIGGFFGFPMAGALFVLELPHRTGLQYFEALTPSVLSSIVAVITNRLIIANDVAGYFKYPFLDTSLPSSIFWHAILYGFFGCAVGSIYLVAVLWHKKWVHEWFHQPSHGENDTQQDETPQQLLENTPYESETESLLHRPVQTVSTTVKQSFLSRLHACSCLAIPNESVRATAAGALAGFVCGWIAIFVPHTLFWGEAQLQNLIDKGRTPMPVFGSTTSDLIALGYCIVDPMDPAEIQAGFGIECSALLAITKTVVIGLSLGTGICGGHFWGPLFVGCAAGHFISDVVDLIASHTVGLKEGEMLTYPCLAILCTMGAAHVVSFRAHTAIMLILTLTISTFTPKVANPYFGIAGDYAAVFPLLVISVFISMIMSQGLVFYEEQKNRGDIIAVQSVLSEPERSESFDEDCPGDLTLSSTTPSPDESPRIALLRRGTSDTDYESTDAVDRVTVPDNLVSGDIERGLRESPTVYGSVESNDMNGGTSANANLLSSRLDELLSTHSVPSSPNVTPKGFSRHRVVQSLGRTGFAPTLFEQARAHRVTISRQNSCSSNLDTNETSPDSL